MNENSLWRFALSQWSRPGMEARCLQLQDQFQVPVSLTLLAHWLASRQRQPDVTLARALSQCAYNYESSMLTPWRARRRQWSGGSETAALKPTLMALELELERRLMMRLQRRSLTALPARKPVAMHSWFVLLIPEASGCEGIQSLIADW